MGKNGCFIEWAIGLNAEVIANLTMQGEDDFV